jgi:hypothetical protein
VRLVTQLLYDGLSNARFADTRLARDQDNTAIAPLRLLPSPHEEVNLLVSTDERCGGRAKRLELEGDLAGTCNFSRGASRATACATRSIRGSGERS